MNISNTRKALGHLLNILDTTKSTVSPIEFPEKKPLLSPLDKEFFPRATPEECGIGSEYIREYIEKLCFDNKIGLQNIMILRENRVIFEGEVGNWDVKMPRATFSECKSIVSLAIGVLVSQGRLKLNERLIDIFPESTQPVSKIRMKNVTVKTLLNMTSCVTFNESEAMVCENWVEEFMNSDTDGNVGVDFKYNSMNTYMLSAVVKAKSGFGLGEFLDMTLFKALEIENYYWEKCPLGIEKGGWGLYICPEDMLKFGVLVMQNGLWKGKRLISPKYIQQATKTHSESPDSYGSFNYGYQIWCGRKSDSFLFNGMLGQNLIGYRKNGIIIAVNCGNCDTFQQNGFFKLTEEFFDKEFATSLPENPESLENLQKLKVQIKNEVRDCSMIPARREKRDFVSDIKVIDGMSFSAVGQNTASAGFAPLVLQVLQGNFSTGLTEVKFRKNKKNLEIDFVEQDSTYKITVGFENPITNRIHIKNEIYSLNCIGRFAENEDGIVVLTVDCNYLETPYSRSFKFHFDKSGFYCLVQESPGAGFSKSYGNLINFLTPHGKKIENVLARFDRDYLSVKLEKAFCYKVYFQLI